MRIKDEMTNEIQNCDERGHHEHRAGNGQPAWEICTHAEIHPIGQIPVTIYDYR